MPWPVHSLALAIPELHPLSTLRKADDKSASADITDPQNRVLPAYGSVFVAGSLASGMGFDGFRPDRWDVIGALIRLAG
jgi:hypothetical protein